MPKEKPRLIWLRRAFLRVLAQFEEADGVPMDRRLASESPDRRDEPIRPLVEATGLNAKLRLGAAPQPKQGGGFYIAIPVVPAVPSSDVLQAILLDRNEVSATSSASEVRIAKVHDWLVGRLSGARIKSWAKQLILPPDGSAAVGINCRAPIEAEWWCDAVPDYRDGVLWLAGEWDGRKDGHWVDGSLQLERIELEEDSLEAELAAKPGSASLVRIDSALGQSWRINWSGVSFEVDCTSAPARSRALLDLQVLLQNPKRSVSCALLAGLDRRKVDQRGGEDSGISLLRRKIDPILRQLSTGDLPIIEAERCLKSILETTPGTSEDTKRFVQMEYDNVANSLKGLKDYLQKHHNFGNPSLTSYLSSQVRFKKGGYQYLAKGNPVAWTISRGSDQSA